MHLFKRHVHLCAHKMELHTHIQAVRASQKHVLVSVQTVPLFAETLIINMRVTDDGEALLPSDMRMFLKNTETQCFGVVVCQHHMHSRVC